MPLLAYVGGVLWGSQARARLVHLNKKSRVLVGLTGLLSKGYLRHAGNGRQGRLLITGAVGEDLSVHLLLCGLLSRAWACMRELESV